MKVDAEAKMLAKAYGSGLKAYEVLKKQIERTKQIQDFTDFTGRMATVYELDGVKMSARLHAFREEVCDRLSRMASEEK